MLWIGLTGSLGTGKSTVAAILKKLGWQVVDADFIAHQVLSRGESAYQQVVLNFGREILNPDQSLDRKKIAQLVFSDPDKLRLLESIVHPAVKLQVQCLKENFIKAQAEMAFYDVPLLFEKNMQKDFNKIVVVTCDEKLQRERLRTRNKWSEAEIDLRLKAQLPMQEKIKAADYLIKNNGSLIELEDEVKRVLSALSLPLHSK
jgi:dephospho-CoA kinase